MLMYELRVSIKKPHYHALFVLILDYDVTSHVLKSSSLSQVTHNDGHGGFTNLMVYSGRRRWVEWLKNLNVSMIFRIQKDATNPHSKLSQTTGI